LFLSPHNPIIPFVTLTSNPSEERTEFLFGSQEITDRLLGCLNNAKNTVYVCADCADTISPSINIRIEPIRKCLEQLGNRGLKINYITEITPTNISYCKTMIEFCELRHLDGIMGTFSLIDKREYLAASVLQATEPPLQQLVYSNVKGVVEQQQYLLETLWNKATPAEQKIADIEEGTGPEFIEVIADHNKASNVLLQLARSAKREVLFLLPNDKALVRMRSLGVLEALGKASLNGADVCIICPCSDVNSEVVYWLNQHTFVKLTNGSEAQSGIIVVDGTRFMSAELINPASERFSDAIGMTLYSNSKRTINLLKTFFHALWEQAELSQKLENQDKLKKEFISIVAHELRTPVQPILGRAELLKSEIESGDYDLNSLREAVEMIIRNSQRLHRLTDDLLTVSRIERNILRLNKVEFDLNAVIEDAMNDVKNQLKIITKDIAIIFQPKEKIVVNADKDKITQVIHNLLGNATKFIEKGTISITAERKKDGNISFTIKDTGIGIDSSLFPRLFQMFATNAIGSSLNQSGPGLGLYISKSIIEAHGGRIWAENNKDGQGATFIFILPHSN
jgi:signal transduction histidine kinase